MLETIISNLSFPTWILAILLSIILLWKIFAWVYNVNNIQDKRDRDRQDFFSKFDRIEQKHDQEKQDFLLRFDSIEHKMDRMSANLKLIADSLIGNDNIKFDHTKLQSYSPLKLTEEGRQFIQALQFDKTFTEHKQNFFDFIDLEKPRAPYDVEIAATKSILFLFDKELL